MTPQAVLERRRATIATDSARHEIREAALAHMVAAVAAARVDDDPSPHFFVAGILPTDIYDELVDALPEPGLYEAFGYEKHATAGRSNRGKFALSNESLAQLSGRQQSLWLGVRDALGSPQFKAAVFERLAGGLAYRFGVEREAAAATPGYPLPELFRETQGYTIKPHPDTRRKLVTMQIALPTDASQRELGTEFYRRSWNPLALMREPRGFEIVKQAPFVPNAAYAFVVINTLRHKSWHGRTRLSHASGVRNTILNIWYSDAEKANADLVEQYYQRG